MHTTRGYTLLEVLSAMAIFVGIVLPLFAFAFRNSRNGQARDCLVASSLIDQECARIRAAPSAWMPERRRAVVNAQWEIRCEVSGTGLRRFHVAACKSGTAWAEAVLMVNQSDQNQGKGEVP